MRDIHHQSLAEKRQARLIVTPLLILNCSMLISCFQLLKTAFEFAISGLFVIESAFSIQLRPQISDLLLIEDTEFCALIYKRQNLSIPLFCLLRRGKLDFTAGFLFTGLATRFACGSVISEFWSFAGACP